MQSKLFLSLALLAVASAALYSEKYIKVNHDGTYCEIVSENGMKVELIKNKYPGSYGLKDFEVVLQGPNFHKTFHINNQIGGDVIFDLCARYQGVVDDLTFEKILYKIEEHVQQGDVHPKVFYMFKCLHDQYAIQHLINDEVYGDDYYFGLYGKTFQHPYGVYGKGLYQHKYGLFGKSFYPQSVYGQLYNRAAECQKCWGIGDVMGLTGKYGPCVCNAEYGYDNELYRTQMPYRFQRYNTGLNKYGMEGLIEKEVEQEVEREVEQEVEHKLGNQLTTGYYGQRYPYFQNNYFNKFWTPRTQQTWGMNQYGRHGLFGNYLGRFNY